jgi:hypothetical protein
MQAFWFVKPALVLLLILTEIPSPANPDGGAIILNITAMSPN